MLRLLSTILLTISGLSLAAQSTPIMATIEQGNPNVRYKVAAKENWYSVGRTFNLRPADIASANGLGIDKPLNIGQSLTIPLTADNFAQSGKPLADEAFVPVYHVVQAGEGLYRIGQSYNKVGSAGIKQLNNLTSDAVQPGRRLVIGYLRVKKGQSKLASAGVAPPASLPTSGQGSDKPAVPPPLAERNQPSAAPVATKPEQARPMAATVPTTPRPSETASTTAGPGYFAGLFEEQSRSGQPAELRGTAASFKSTSGWNDGKYYALMNGVDAGTIVKVTDPSGGRSIYVKVLGDLPPIRENEALQARLSNAAMAQLGLPEGMHTLSFQWRK